MPRTPDARAPKPTRVSDHDALHAWVLGLPWVVERPYSLGVPGVRSFAVDCAPAGVRSVWLVTGLPNGAGVGVVVPRALGADLDLLRLAEPIAPMPPVHVFAVVCAGVDEHDLERVLLEAYATAFA
jgi:hypothetical protein